jgi:hypothetical protein
VEERNFRQPDERPCRGCHGLGARALQELEAVCVAVSDSTDSTSNGLLVRIDLEVEEVLAIALPVLLAILSLQLPDQVAVFLQELASHTFNALLCASHQESFHMLFLSELFDIAEKFPVAVFAQLEPPEKIEIVVDCDSSFWSVVDGTEVENLLESPEPLRASLGSSSVLSEIVTSGSIGPDRDRSAIVSVSMSSECAFLSASATEM